MELNSGKQEQEEEINLKSSSIMPVFSENTAAKFTNTFNPKKSVTRINTPNLNNTNSKPKPVVKIEDEEECNCAKLAVGAGILFILIIGVGIGIYTYNQTPNLKIE